MSLRAYSSTTQKFFLPLFRSHRTTASAAATTLLQLSETTMKRNRAFSNSTASYDKIVHDGRTVPTIDQAKEMPVSFSAMDNQTLVTIASMGNNSAQTEVLKRHIMGVDNVEYEEATKVVEKIFHANKHVINMGVVPYFIGVGGGMGAAFFALPMVFDLTTALWFNEDFVTTDVPEPRDLETWLEVGSWTWNWMEPPLGTLSFVLLCLQFSRNQYKNLGLHPYTSKLRNTRADRLAAKFPHYDSDLVKAYSKSIPLVTSFQVFEQE